MMTILALGDIMPGGLLSLCDSQYVSDEVTKMLESADLRIGNFECAVETSCPSGKKYSAGGNTIYVREKDVSKVKELGVDIVSLANNHLFDLGPEGALKAINILEKLGISHCGAGRNLKEACKPVIVRRNGNTYAFIAFSDTRWRYMYEATENTPGVNPLKEQHVIKEIKRVAEIYDYVIVIPHWGVEYSYFPQKEVERLSKSMIDAGADLILGGHAHKIQPVIKFKEKYIAYCLGNFLFPDRIINTPKNTWYPNDNKIDISSLPQVVGKCPTVDTPTIKLWYPCAYTGMILQCTFLKNEINTRYSLISTTNNYVKPLAKGGFLYRLILYLIGHSIRYNYYDFIFGISSFYKRVKRRIELL